MSEEFKPGDVVQMRSGGVTMTVSEVRADGVEVRWMDGAQSKIDVFPASVLVKYEQRGGFVPRKPSRTKDWF